MRISELIQAKVSWFDENKPLTYGLFYESPKIRTKGSGKIGKVISRLILHDAFKVYLDKWLVDRKALLEKKEVMEDHDYLFVNLQGMPATEAVLRGYLPKWEKILQKPYYFHAARHYFTTTLVNTYKLNTDVVKNIVRWSSADLVTLYNDKSDEIDMEELANLKLISANAAENNEVK